MVGVPLSSIARISSNRLKPPQKTVGFSGIENKLPNKQTNKQISRAFQICKVDSVGTSSGYLLLAKFSKLVGLPLMPYK